MRSNWLCTAFLALGHGVPLFHAGDELLRSKSLDRDSYNSGDWFNLLDFTGERSAFGTGLPVADKNRGKWDMMRPLLRDPRLQPTPEMARATIAKFCELLAIRKSTALFGLREAEDILTKVKFPGCGRHQVPGVVMMEVTNGRAAAGPNAGLPLCDQYARVVVVFSSRPSPVRIPVPASSSTGTLQLHPLQASSTDERTRQAFVDEEKDELFVPALSAIVFVEPLPGRDGYKAHPLKRNFSCAVM
ncbi:PU1 [Symbiodinium sp. CCMP2592]|nr:PU1 [Symbiodinium sp. CCMP2592]